ncbi:MAG: arginine deiminase-related protein [Pseudomonadota bacterium]
MTQQRDKILMCPPDYFTVNEAINPWMAGNEGQPDQQLAAQQWDTLVAKISEFADVVTMPAQPELPDMVFTANAGAVYGEKAIASHFMPHERRPEEQHFKQWFRDNGFELLDLDEKLGFEGAGDCLVDRGGPWLWTGYGFRTELEAHSAIADFFGRELVSIKLVDPRFYHIDTCFCPLTDGFLMYHPPAFDFDSRMAIETRVPPHKRIVVDTIDAGNFACNAVNVGHEIFVNSASEPLKAQLMNVGFRVHEIDLSEFLKSGGSAKCLTLKLTEPVTGA